MLSTNSNDFEGWVFSLARSHSILMLIRITVGIQ